MILALLLAAAEPETAIDAERAFARDAITEGTWTAFLKWADDEAIVFTPQPSKAHEVFKELENPPIPIIWWPGRSYVSCDGEVAINTGPWVHEEGRQIGFFTTVWVKKGGKWRWVYDGGNTTEKLRAEGGDIKPIDASCSGKPSEKEKLVADVLDPHSDEDGSTRASPEASNGQSPDGTLSWSWAVDEKGARHFVAQLWTGKDYETVIEDRVPAPSPASAQ